MDVRRVTACVIWLLVCSLSLALSPREIAEQASSAVVLIETQRDDETTAGSGFLVDDEGSIVTALHVVDGASSIVVAFEDGTRLEEVEVRAFDVERDLVVLDVDLPATIRDLNPLELGDTESVARGSEIVIIGNPMGFGHTVTEGIVGAWRAPKTNETQRARSALPSTRVLQISATILPGSSGGPVLNDRAQVIGIVSSGLLWGLADLNFAVPIDALTPLLTETEQMDLDDFVARVESTRREMARPYFDDGRMAFLRGEPEEAEDLIERALALFPHHEEGLLLSGQIAMEAGDVETATRRFALVTELDEYNVEAWFHLGDAQLRTAFLTNDPAAYARAHRALERAVEIDPRHGRAAYRLALIHIHAGDLRMAERRLITATENEPGLTDAYYTLGELYFQRGRFSDAKKVFERALWQDREHAMSHFGMARVYMELERSHRGTVSPNGNAPYHWEEFLRLSENDPNLAEEREVAIFYIKQFFPHLLD